MKFLVTVYDDSPQFGDARNPSILLVRMNVELRFKDYNIPLTEREEWIKFKNMIIKTYGYSNISIGFYEEKSSSVLIDRF